MGQTNPDPNSVWLAGGDPTTAWTYGDLWASFSTPPQPAGTEKNVGSILRRLARAVWLGEEVELGEMMFSGEGEPDRRPPAPAAAPPARPSMGAILLRTSGTTGSARIVRHSLDRLAAGVSGHPRHRCAVWALAFNPTHMAGVQVCLQAWAHGNPLVNLWGTPARVWADRCTEWGVTHLSATPTFFRLLLAEGRAWPTLRSLSLGGESADARLVAALRTMFPAVQVRNIYATTESGAVLCANADEFVVPPRLAGLVRVAGGTLWLHRGLMAETTASGEWFDTGDEVEVTSREPLRFRIVGRTGTVLNVGGEKVVPDEVEAVLAAHPRVVAARVYRRSNSVTGYLLAAEIVGRDGFGDEGELRAFAASRLSEAKVPRLFRFVAALPMTGTGKLSRREDLPNSASEFGGPGNCGTARSGAE